MYDIKAIGEVGTIKKRIRNIRKIEKRQKLQYGLGNPKYMKYQLEERHKNKQKKR